MKKKSKKINKSLKKRTVNLIKKSHDVIETQDVSKSVGAIVLNQYNHVLLVFQQRNQYWEFPKGKVEAGEREKDTLKREIFEETGIKDFEFVADFCTSMNYTFQYKGALVHRKVVYYLIRTSQRVRISSEHSRYAWLSLERAKKRLKHQSQIDLMDVVKEIASGKAYGQK